ncbi:MAG: hypothetical protein SGJ24_00175 [Chloroflexota bacterium]|jgi:hypothetical protein|nr:hypothetical protein [Chloroflexota bacterium]
MITLLVHINNAEPVKLDVEDIPKPTDNALIGKNPREKTDKEVNWIEEGVTTLILPWWRITFIEVLPSGTEEEEFPLPFRND